MTHQELQLMGDLRQAIENFVGDAVDEPWDSLIEELTVAIADGGLTASRAARVDLLLQRTAGGPGLTDCSTCRCPMPGMAHL
jgi:hypothetical protein